MANEIKGKLTLDVTDFVNNLKNAKTITDQTIQNIANQKIKLDVDTTAIKNLEAVSQTGGTQAGGKLREAFSTQFAKIKDSLGDVGKTMLGVFGGGLIANGISGIVGSFKDLLEAGKKVAKTQQEVELALRQTGLEGDELKKSIKGVNSVAAEMSDKFAIPVSRVRQLSVESARFGGVSGEMNTKLTTVAIGLEKLTGGSISGEMAIRAFSKSINSPEAQEGLGKLTNRFPPLAAAMAGITDPAQKVDIALKFLQPSLKAMEEQAQSPIAVFERFQNKLASIKTAIGSLIMNALSPFLKIIGDMLLPAISGVVDWIKSLSNYIPILQPILTALGVTIMGLVVTFGAYTAILTVAGFANKIYANSELQKAIQIVWSKAQMLAGIVAVYAYAAASAVATAAQWLWNAALAANPIALVIIAIAALVAGFVVLWNTSETFRNVMIAIWNFIKDSFILAINGLWNLLKGIGNFIGTIFVGYWGLLQKALSFLGISLPSLSDLWTGFVNILKAAGGWISNVIDKIMSFLGLGKEDIAQKNEQIKLADEQNAKDKERADSINMVNDTLNKSTDEIKKQILEMKKQGKEGTEAYNLLVSGLKEKIKTEKDDKIAMLDVSLAAGEITKKEYDKQKAELQGIDTTKKSIDVEKQKKKTIDENVVALTNLEIAHKKNTQNFKDLWNATQKQVTADLEYKETNDKIKKSLESLYNTRKMLLEQIEVAEPIMPKMEDLGLDKLADDMKKNPLAFDIDLTPTKTRFQELKDMFKETDGVKKYFKTLFNESSKTTDRVAEGMEALTTGTQAGFKKMVSEGTLSFQNIGKVALSSLLDYAEKQILILTPDILAMFTASIPPPFGTIAGFAAIGVIEGLMSLAKSQLAFKDGVVNFQGKGTETSDSNDVRISKGETIVPAKATKNNLGLLTYIVKTGKNAIDYFSPSKQMISFAPTYENVGTKLDRLNANLERMNMNKTQKFKHEFSSASINNGALEFAVKTASNRRIAMSY